MSFDYFWHKILGRPYRLYSIRYGVEKRQKPVIVLLHGLAASGKEWEDFISLLSDDYECIAIDLLGFGQSPKPSWCEYDMEAHMSALTNTMDKLGLGKDYILVGHSLGSLLASRYARDHGKHIKRLVLLSPPVYPPLETISGRLAKTLTGILLRAYKFLRNDTHITPERFEKISKILPLPRGVILNPDTWQPFMRTLQHCIEQQTIINDISTVSMPVEVFYGTLDQVLVTANIELLNLNPHVTLHPFIGNHDLTKRYAKLFTTTLSTMVD